MIPRAKGTALIAVLLTCCGAAERVAEPVTRTPVAVTVSPATLQLEVGSTARLSARVVDIGGHVITDVAVRWTASDAAEVRVDGSGNVDGVAAGSAIVRASAGTASGTSAVSVAPRPPARVEDLRVLGITDSSVTLGWTEVEDGEGRPAGYALRQAMSTIAWETAVATEVALEGNAVGAVREYASSGLLPGTSYEFQLVTRRDTVSGPLSNVASTATSGEASVPTSIRFSAASLRLDIGTGVTLSAEIVDQFGNAMDGHTLTWSSADPSVVTVDSAGVVAAVGLGETKIRAQSGTVTGDVEVVVGEAPQDAPHAHEPAGFRKIAEDAFDKVTASGWDLFPSGTQNLSIVSDSTAPRSPGGVGAGRYAAGMKGGVGPFTLVSKDWKASEVYLEFWFKVSKNWQGHNSNVNKIFFVFDTETGKGGAAPLVVEAYGKGSDPLQLVVVTQNTPGSDRIYRATSQDNRAHASASDAEIVRGQWRHIEALFKLNTPGLPDGELHMWVDGRKTHEFLGQTFVGLASDGKLDGVKWNGTFGGGNSDSVRDEQYQYIDHIYVSGRE